MSLITICLNIFTRWRYLSANRFTIDLIVPQSLGGSDDIDNLALACRRTELMSQQNIIENRPDRT
jgi:HNH endonuclease